MPQLDASTGISMSREGESSPRSQCAEQAKTEDQEVRHGVCHSFFFIDQVSDPSMLHRVPNTRPAPSPQRGKSWRGKLQQHAWRRSSRSANPLVSTTVMKSHLIDAFTGHDRSQTKRSSDKTRSTSTTSSSGAFTPYPLPMPRSPMPLELPEEDLNREFIAFHIYSGFSFRTLGPTYGPSQESMESSNPIRQFLILVQSLSRTNCSFAWVESCRDRTGLFRALYDSRRRVS